MLPLASEMLCCKWSALLNYDIAGIVVKTQTLIKTNLGKRGKSIPTRPIGSLIPAKCAATRTPTVAHKLCRGAG